MWRNKNKETYRIFELFEFFGCCVLYVIRFIARPGLSIHHKTWDIEFSA